MEYRQSHVEKGIDYDKKLTSGFDLYMARREKEILSKIIPNLVTKKMPRFLDFACGTGRITQLIETMTETCYGVDISARMVEQARKRCTKTRFIVKDPTREALGLEMVDLVTAFRFFGNAQDELRVAAMNCINDVLAAKGCLIMNNHRNPCSIRNKIHRLRDGKVNVDLTHHKLKTLLKRAGFSVVAHYGIGIWVWRDKLMTDAKFDSSFAAVLEKFSKVPFLTPYCPDAVIVAQKIS